MDSLKPAITRIRNILRLNSISDMNSMRTIGIYFTARFIDEAMVKQLKIDPKLTWDSLYALCEDGQMDISLELFKNKLLPCLDEKLSTHKFSFDIANVHSHREIMNVIKSLDFEKLQKETDILGVIYELHLESGSGNGRDLGQFFTDRSVCKFMVDLVQPKMKSKGIPESICDPSMGTGGFLNLYISKLQEHKINWKVQQQQIHGCDTDERVVGIANINLFLQTHAVFNTLIKQDSVRRGLPMSQYDIILANPPFGIDPIPNEELHTSIKSLNISNDHPEPMFLQLIMYHLAPGGRSAVIMPNGFLENQYADDVATRKYLVEHFNVKQIIRFDTNVSKGPKRGSIKESRFFIGTGVKCSIIFFENNGKGTNEIEFYDMKKTGRNLEVPTLIRKVPIEKINSDQKYSLDVSKYIPVDPNAPTLDLLCNYENGRTIKGGNPNSGSYPIMGGGKTYNGLNTQYNREPNTISISKSGTAGYVHWHTEKFWAGDCFTVETKDPNVLNNRYLYYYLHNNSELIAERRTGSTVPHCKWEDIRKLPIVLPPINKQNEIVEEMDKIYKRKEEAEEFIKNFSNFSKDSFYALI